MSVIHPSDVEAIEEQLLSHWANFGSVPGGRFMAEAEFTWTEAPIAQLPYNAVLKTHVVDEPDRRVREMIERFEARNVRFLWIVTPSSRPADLASMLVHHGLSLIARETGMVLSLDSHTNDFCEPLDPVYYRLVTSVDALGDYEDLVVEYWSLPRESRPYVHTFSENAFTAGNRGIWLLAYMRDLPVAKAYLSLLGAPDTASIWGVYVRPAARGFGIGSGLTRLAIRYAAEHGRKRVVLVSTDMGINVYRRIGFKETCELPVYANASVLPALQGIQPA